jgi:hypothetical protein
MRFFDGLHSSSALPKVFKICIGVGDDDAAVGVLVDGVGSGMCFFAFELICAKYI